MKAILRLPIFLSIFLSICCTVFAATLPTGFNEKRLATGLDPTGVTVMPDGRVLVTIKTGKILLLKNEVVQTTPLLTIPNTDNWNERGLLSVVIDPGFSTNGYIYVYYTYKNPSTNVSNNRVSRFKVTGDIADANSQLVLIDFDNLSSVGWHNGGGLVYGTDGKIYASTGENANASNAQSMSNLLGKVVRINPDGTIPTDNPFYTSASGKNRAIYALGFRNPFKLKLQPGTGKIYINDVGAGTWEEINELKAGRNYGWPTIEGKRTNQTPPVNYEDPLYAYNHSGACSITGGAFYNPSTVQFPASYQGKYFYMDYCGGWIRTIDPATNYTMATFATGIDRPLDMAVDENGNLYYLARGGLGGGSDADNTSSSEGELWKVSYTGNGEVNIGVQPQNKSVAVGASVTFVVGATGAAPLKYQWQRNGVDIPGAELPSYTISPVALADNGDKFKVIVSNTNSSKTSTEVTLSVFANTAPTAQILTPSANTLYEAGTTIQFSGTATDAEDGTLAASAFTWYVHFHHDVHYHPAMDAVSGITSGSFLIPDEGEPSDTVWYRIYLTVQDALGTKTTVYRDIYPKKVNVTLNTNPAGIPLKLDGTSITTPHTFTGVVGLKRSIEADKTRLSGNDLYAFSKWSINGTSLQTITTPNTNTTYTATYVLAKTDTLGVVADAYVRGGTNANNAYGATDPTLLQTKSETTFDFTRQSFLRFDISTASDILGARLRLFGNKNSSENSNISVGVFGVKNVTWNENTLTWNNKPTADTTLLDVEQVNVLAAQAQYYEWEVSDYLRAAKQTGATSVSFLVANPEVTTSFVQFNSKEAVNNKPQLVLTVPKGPLGNLSTIGEEESASLYPNPFADAFTLQVAGPFSYTVYDLLGNIAALGSGENSAQLGTGLMPGTYLVQVKNKQGTSMQKVTKL